MTFEDSFRKIIRNKVEFYCGKYEFLKKVHLITASFINPRTKSFKNTSDNERKAFIEIAINQIKKLCSIPNNNLHIVNPQPLTRTNRELTLSDDSDDEITTTDLLAEDINSEIRRLLILNLLSLLN